MPRSLRISVRAAATGALLTLLSAPPVVRGQSLDAAYGWWWHDASARLYTLTYHTPVIGPLSLGLAGVHVDDSRAIVDRTSTGGELSVLLGRSQRGLYGIGAAGLGVRHSDGNVDAAWSAGIGYTLRFLSFLALGIEVRYRLEDTDVSGFWNGNPDDRDGFQLQGRILIGGDVRRPNPSDRPPTTAPVPPPTGPPTGTPSSEESVRVAASIVETALGAMGTPYRWGGNDENGYDCSGLIQWAYGQHGIVLPRTSRDQARMGSAHDRTVTALTPGDVLTFAAGGSGVSHVGLYVGEGDFIHSSSSGVRLSSLVADDPDSRWWQQRWVGVRRILN